RCKYLATLKRDVKIVYSKEDLKLEPFNQNEMISFLKELEFNSFLREVSKNTISNVEINYEIISDVNAKLEDILNTEGYLNIEYFGKTYYSGDFLGISFVSESNKIFITKDVVLNNRAVKDYLE